MLLPAALLAFSILFFWAGFRAPPHALQHQSKAGFFLFSALVVFSSYFGFREATALSDLRAVIDPVPNVTDVSYVPSRAEASGISDFIAALPAEGRMGTAEESRRRLAEASKDRNTDYWIIKTTLSPDAVVGFYRDAGLRRGWALESESSPFLFLARGSSRLAIFVSDQSPGAGSRVLYALSSGS